MDKHAELLSELTSLALRADAAGTSSARLLVENVHLRQLAAAQLRQLREMAQDFSAQGPIRYPGPGLADGPGLAPR